MSSGTARPAHSTCPRVRAAADRHGAERRRVRQVRVGESQAVGAATHPADGGDHGVRAHAGKDAAGGRRHVRCHPDPHRPNDSARGSARRHARRGASRARKTRGRRVWRQRRPLSADNPSRKFGVYPARQGHFPSSARDGGLRGLLRGARRGAGRRRAADQARLPQARRAMAPRQEPGQPRAGAWRAL